MRLVTLQDKSVLNILKSGQTYYADYNKILFSDYKRQWQKLAEFLGFSECPIFCAPENNQESIDGTFIDSRAKGNKVLIKLNVPDSECYVMEYYDFSDWLYYSDGQEYDEYLHLDAEGALNNIDKYIKLDNNAQIPQVVINRIEPEWLSNKMRESLIVEDTRKQLIDKSKDARATKAYGTNRYERKNMQHIYNSLNSFNKIDMNALYHSNLLSFILPVHGETDNYSVEFLFEGVCDDIKREIKRNNNVLEYKCVYRALINAINSQDIYIACSCPDWKYRFAYHSTKGGYNGGAPELRPAKITNPNNDLGIGCKHVMAALDHLEWAIKLATTIYNYIIYMEEHYSAKFQTIMFPKLFDISWEEYSGSDARDITGDTDLADTMDNAEDETEIDKANVYGGTRYTPTKSDMDYAHEGE